MRQFYTLLAQRRYEEAYAMLGADFQAREPYPSWRAGYNTTESIVLLDVSEVSRAPAVVYVSIQATDLLNGQRVTRRFEGTWTLATRAGVWKLESARLGLAR